MQNYQHILLAVDFSEQGYTVAQKAQSLANAYSAKLSMVHVLDNIPMPDTNYGTIIDLVSDSGDPLLESEKNKLLALGRRFAIDVENQWLIWGVPKNEITLLAEQQKVDLIVIGSHGRHGLALLLGSAANDVLHHASCDVLAVHLRSLF